MDLMLSGFKLMVFGMGAVLAFLIIMIICMYFMQKIIAPFAGKLEAANAAPAPKAAPKTSAEDQQLAAIAAVAVELAKK